MNWNKQFITHRILPFLCKHLSYSSQILVCNNIFYWVRIRQYILDLDPHSLALHSERIREYVDFPHRLEKNFLIQTIPEERSTTEDLENKTQDISGMGLHKNDKDERKYKHITTSKKARG